jgi:hypothetical protein
MATTVADAEAMVAACARAGVRYGTAFNQRFHPAHVRLGELVAAGALGQVTQARVKYACETPPWWGEGDWHFDRARAGGGALFDLAPHGLDLLGVLLARELTEAVALHQRAVLDHPVEDGAVIAARYEEVLAVLQVSYAHPETLPRRELELVGTKGMAVARDTMGQDAAGRSRSSTRPTGCPSSSRTTRRPTRSPARSRRSPPARGRGPPSATCRCTPRSSRWPAREPGLAAVRGRARAARAPVRQLRLLAAPPRVPAACPLCLDARHVVPQDAWRFWTAEEAQARFPMHWAEVEPGVHRFWNDPVCGIGASAYLVTTGHGNLVFEGGAVFTEAALEHVAALGGVAVLSASHPHSYGALWQLQDRFDPELCLHPGDLEWSGAVRVTWPFDDVLEPLPGLELHLTAGHFAGHTALLDRARRILFCGDALKFELDAVDPRRATAISAHKAFVRGIPLTHAELRRYRDVLHPLDFTQTWTPFEQAANVGRPEVLALIDRFLDGRPEAAPVPLTALGVRG